MKILFAVPSYYDEKYKLTNNAATGQAIIAGDLCRGLSNYTDLDIVVTGRPIRGVTMEYANILNTSYVALLKKSKINLIKKIRFSGSVKKTMKSFYVQLLKYHVEDYVYINRYDLICIHDFGEENMEILRSCQLYGQKCIVTLHMYVGKNTLINDITLKKRAIREKYLFENTNVPVTVVSSGMKKRIIQDHPGVSPSRITVIPNGINVSKYLCSQTNYICGQSRKNSDKKIFLCIGTIGVRKNQIQLLSALECLSKTEQAAVKVLFIGADTLNGKLQKFIKEKHLENSAEYIGVVAHEDLNAYYNNAYAVISTSLNEAFGLTFIEGFCRGMPALYFYDIDAAEDIYASDAVELILGKSNNDIAAAIRSALKKEWNRNLIQKHAMNFDIEKVTERYYEVYKSVVD